MLEMGNTQRSAEQALDRGDAIKLETAGNQEEFVQEPDVSLKEENW